MPETGPPFEALYGLPDKPSTQNRNLQADWPDSEIADEIKHHHLLLARSAELREDWHGAIKHYRRIVDLNANVSGDVVQSIALLSSIQNTPLTDARKLALKELLSACTLERNAAFTDAMNVLQRLRTNPNAEFIADHVLYRLACLYREFKLSEQCIQTFLQIASRYPSSSLCEPSLIMAARTCILAPDVTPARLQAGAFAANQILQNFPNSRFRKSAFGLLARIKLLNHDASAAFNLYARTDDVESLATTCSLMMDPERNEATITLLAHRLKKLDCDPKPGADHTDLEAYACNIRDIKKAAGSLTPEGITRFRAMLARDPQALSCYLYYRLNYTEAEQKDMPALIALARKGLSQINPIHQGMIYMRMAEAAYLHRDLEDTLAFSSKAMNLCPDFRDRALFMHASALVLKQTYERAQAEFLECIHITSDDVLHHNAMEQLAIAAERAHKYALALKQYIALGYETDIAYLLDLLMKGDEITSVLSQHDPLWEKISWPMHAIENALHGRFHEPDGEAPREKGVRLREELRYAAGMAYLREGKFQRAITSLSALAPYVREALDEGRATLGSQACPPALNTAQQLYAFSNKIEHAASAEAKAAAMYQMACYYHNNGCLLLYNASLWNGSRVLEFEIFLHKETLSKSQIARMQDYLNHHEVYLISRRICAEILTKYPHSKVAPDALYRQACATIRVGALADWYSKEFANLAIMPTANEASNLFKKLTILYPHSPLSVPAKKYCRLFSTSIGNAAAWPHYINSRASDPLYRNLKYRDASALALESMERYLEAPVSATRTAS